MDAPAPPPPIPSMPAAPFTVAEDIPCRRCGYNLRGLQSTGQCPECGAEVALSVLGDRLRFSDPQWVAKVGRGCRLIILGLAVSLLTGCVMVIVSRALTGGRPVLTQLIALAAGLIAFCGNWLLTTPEPTHEGEDKLVTARRVARFGTLIGAGQGFVQFGITSLAPGWASMILLICMGVLISAATVAGEFAKYFYVEKLAARIPDPKLERNARRVRWAMTIATSFGLIAEIVTAVYVTRFTRVMLATAATSAPAAGIIVTSSSQTGVIYTSTSGPAFPTSGPAVFTAARGGGGAMAIGFIAMGCFGVLFGLAFLVIYWMAISVIWRLGKALKTESAAATTHWSTPAP